MYFIDAKTRKESKSTDYIEFQKGNKDGSLSWLDDSTYIDAEDFKENGLSKLFVRVNDEFDFYGVTKINRMQWEDLVDFVSQYNYDTQNIIEELSVWVDDCFDEYEEFTIIGI